MNLDDFFEQLPRMNRENKEALAMLTAMCIEDFAIAHELLVEAQANPTGCISSLAAIGKWLVLELAAATERTALDVVAELGQAFAAPEALGFEEPEEDEP